MLPACFAPFLKRVPLAVLARTSLESLFDSQRLDALFQTHSQKQYQRELLFSHLVDLMMAVILGTKTSLRAAYLDQADEGRTKVSIQALYGKLQRTELGVSEALVRESAVQLSEVLAQLNADRPALLPGYRVRVLDGNLLSKTERRIGPLRDEWARGLPGRALVVYDHQSDLVTHVFLHADGHACERSRMADVMALAKPGEVWLADANFCVLSILQDWKKAKTSFVVRHRGNCPGKLLGERRSRGRTDNGEVFEQWVQFQSQGVQWRVRRITLVLDEPTRDGVKELHLLSNLPAKVSAKAIAKLYRNRWSIENRFFEMSQTLEAEPKSLGYPPAALLAFCLGLMASNAAALMRASLRSCHPAEKVDEMSRQRMADQIRETTPGLVIAIEAEEWEKLECQTPEAWAELLRWIAQHVKVEFFQKATRGPKKPPPKMKPYRNGHNLSNHRELEKRKLAGRTQQLPSTTNPPKHN